VRVASDHQRRGVHHEEDDAAGHSRLGPRCGRPGRQTGSTAPRGVS
jgi:hypothetical protein